ncbi:MAG: hypothetical protein AB8B71_11395 [Paracoccaceae bacterium]
MVQVIDRTILDFKATDVSLYGQSKPLNFGWTSGNEWVVTVPKQVFNLVDASAGPFGAIQADIGIGFQFGIRLNIGLGGLGDVDTAYKVGVDVEYDDFVIAGRPNEGDGPDVVFDFTKASVISATSSSNGIGNSPAPNVPELREDDQPDIPLGLSLELIAGLDVSIENIEYRVGLRDPVQADDVQLLDFENQAVQLFKVDRQQSRHVVELSDDVELVVRIPFGADTEGASVGSTIVSNKGFSNNPFLSIEGDLDALILERLQSIPFIGTVASALKNTVFFEEEVDVSELSKKLSFLPKDWFKIEAAVVDLTAQAGLHVTEEVSVDLGYKDEENLPDFQLGGGTTLLDQINGVDPTIAGEAKTPNVNVVLRSDNGTPDNLLDDKVAQGSLGEKIKLGAPDQATGIPGMVTVDAFFDVDSAKVSHSVGLGGSLSITLDILKLTLTGKIGDKLGISIGPQFTQKIPEDGFQAGLFNFFTRRFDVEGGSFENLPGATLNSSNDDVSEWDYTPGDFNQERAQYQYFWSNVFDESLDESDPESRDKTIAFAEGNKRWVQEVRAKLDPIYEDAGIDPNSTIIMNSVVDDIVDLFRFSTLDSAKLSDQAVLWTASGSSLSEVRLAFGFNNLVIAAPQDNPSLDGMGTDYSVTISAQGNPVTVTGQLDNGLGKLDIQDFFTRLDQTRNESGGQTGSYNFNKIVYGTRVLDSELSPSIVGTNANDLVVFFGEEDVTTSGVRGFDAPVYLDGGDDTGAANALNETILGAQNDAVTMGDIFLANFAASFPQSAVSWDMRTEELAEQAVAGAQVSTTISGSQPGGGGASVTVSTGAFAASKLEFYEGDTLVHTTAVRDFETYLIRFGDQADLVRTGTSGRELLQFQGGDDQLVIVSDRFGDSYMMGQGEDFVVWERGFFAINPPNLEDTADFILGGAGHDVVLISSADDIDHSNLLGRVGLGWAVEQEGFGLSDYVTVDSSAQDMLSMLSSVNDVLGSDEDAFGAIADFDGGGPLQTQTYVQLSPQASSETSALRIASDVEVINVDGFDETADLVMYTGGTAYSGGTADTDGDQPGDVFVADFGAFEAEKTVDGVAPSGLNLDAARNGVVFADAYVGEFERFVVKGTSQQDVLRGGADTDFLDGGAENDFLSGGGSGFALDTLVGGQGDDVFFQEAGQGAVIFGDQLNAVTQGVDTDLLILQGPVDDDGTGPDRGLLYQVTDSAGGAETLVTTTAAFADANTAADLRAAGAITTFGFGNDSSGAIIAFGIEHTNIQGSDAWDDVLIYDGGSTYLGGERQGDADFFVADFSDQIQGLDFVIEDDPAGQGVMSLANGVILAGIDRISVEFGLAQDTVRGGSLDDYIDGGAGNDVLSGAGGADRILGGADEDFVYWQGDHGADTISGGTGLDRLLISNMSETGESFGAGGMVLDALNADGGFFTPALVTASSGFTDVDALLKNIDQAATWIVNVGSTEMRFSEFEAVDVQGSNEFDDAVLFQGGLIYAGGDRDGDADLFLANLSGESNDLRLRVLDPSLKDEPGREFLDLGNDLGTQIGQFERYHVITGTGDDTVSGGDLDDVFETGGGDDVLQGSLGDDRLSGGADNDLFTYIGGNDLVFGGTGDSDILEVAAQDSGYQLGLFAGGQIIVSLDASDADAIANNRLALNTALNTDTQDLTLLRHDFGSVMYQDIEFVNTTGSSAGDVFTSGLRGGVISSDGGDDILVSRGGDDFLIGGEGLDRYVFGDTFGRDIIANEFSGPSEVHFIGLNQSDLDFRTDSTGNNLVLALSPSNQVSITGYFAQSANPQNFTFFFDDALNGVKFDASDLSTTQRADQITGAQFFGTSGDDAFFEGTDRAEFFFGFAGDDTFFGSLGADLLDGSLGDDFVDYADNNTGISIDLRNFETATGGLAEGDIFASVEGVLATEFDDMLRGSSADNSLVSGAGADTVIGFDGNDLISALEGGDLIDAGRGDDLIFAGSGDDTVRADFDSDAGNDVILGEEGDDLIVDLQGDNQITGGQGDDTVTTGTGDDIYLIEGEADPDGSNSDLNGGRDSWTAGAGNDLLDVSNFGAGVSADLSALSGILETTDQGSFDPAGPTRILATFTGVENLTGTDFGDILLGSADANVITAEAGDDRLSGRAGDDTLDGGLGRDVAIYRTEGGSARVSVNLDTGIATDSFGNTDTLIDIEDIQGTDFNDALTGDAQDNRLTGFAGDDILVGGAGIDTADYSLEDGTSGVEVTLDSFAAFDTYGDLDRVFDIETFILTDKADMFTGADSSVNIEIGAGNDTITGSSEADVIVSGLGTNTIDGAGGDDTYIYANGSNDFFDGGSGFDTLNFINSTLPVALDMPGGIVFRLNSAQQLMTFDGIEQVAGSVLDDGLFGFNGDDVLIGWAGNDRILGRNANDTLFGNSGDDTLEGGNGDDEIHGGSGNDTVLGEAGADTYFYTGGRDTVDGGGNDAFAPGFYDVLSFEGLDQGIGLSAPQGDAYALESVISGPLTTDTDLVIGAGAELLVDFRNIEHLIGTDQGDLIDNVANSGRMEQIDLLGGDDVLISQGAFAIYDGGDGFDIVSYAKTGFAPSDLGFQINLLTGRTTAINPDDLAGDRLTGFEGVIGTTGGDDFIGDSRDNYFMGLTGRDSYVGGAGSDIIDFSRETGSGQVVVNLPSSSVRDTYGNFEFVQDIESVFGSKNNDSFTGDGADNLFDGGAGNDFISAGAGNDTLLSGAGSDTLRGGDDDDLLVHQGTDLSEYDGGNGQDWIDLSQAAAAVSIDLSGGAVRSNGAQIATLASIENAAGSAFDDVIRGDDQANQLTGDLGGDIFTGFGGDDSFVGGAGFDIVDYSQEAGTTGVGASLKTKLGQDRAGALDSFNGIEGLIGTDRADLFLGDDGDNLFVGNAGVDTLDGGAGQDTLDFSRETGTGGLDVDMLFGEARDTFGARDVISGFEVVIGTDQNDIFRGGTTDAVFHGGGGSDSITGGTGSDTVSGGSGADLFEIVSGGANLTVTDFEVGVDFLNLRDFEFLDARDALDNATGTVDTTIQFAQGGRLVLEGVAVDELDQINIRLPNAFLPVFEAPDGGGAVDGTERSESLLGSTGNDALNGGKGDDVLIGGPGNDTLDGGQGQDDANYAGEFIGNIVVDMQAGTVTRADGIDTLVSIETVTGTSRDDIFVGSRDPDHFIGGRGQDMFRPGSGGDMIETGEGADQIEGALSDLDGDRVTDFDSEDMILVTATALNAASMRLFTGSAVFEIDADSDGVVDARFTLDGDFDQQSFEIVSDGVDTTIQIAPSGATQLSVAGERFITTGSGENRVFGDAGGDAILTSGGDDILSGGRGDDVLQGGSGADILIGGLGSDQMIGGADADIFAIDAGDFGTGLTADFIVDFTPGEDMLELTGFGLTSFGDLAIGALGGNTSINLGSGRFVLLEDLDPSSFGANDVSFGDVGRSYGLVSTTIVHSLSSAADRFLTTDERDNEVYAGAGGDVVIGAGGSDSLFGEAGDDLLQGGAGFDVLQGGQGLDRLVGGADSDVFIFEAGEETGTFIVDVIADFSVAEGDLIALNGFGLDVDSVAFLQAGANVAIQLAPTHLIVLEGISDSQQLGPLQNVFDFG